MTPNHHVGKENFENNIWAIIWKWLVENKYESRNVW